MTTPKPKPRTSLEQLNTLVDALRERIHGGHLVPGQRLIEIDIMAEAGITRARVREALRRLEAEGLVEIHRNRGASVRRIARREVADTLEVLCAISELMADKAVARARDPGVRAILERSLADVRSFREQVSAVEQSRRFMDENARFWSGLAALSDNPVLTDTRWRLETTLFRLALEGARVTSAKGRWIMHHEEILLAILAGDRARARRHVADAVAAVEAAIQSLPDSVFS
jgi:DNA-binding GntR family transcriptional regulator